MVEENENGLNIEIVDQDGRSMFPDGAKEPYERTRRLIQKLAAPLKAMPNRISITGHTAASRSPPRPGYGPWELSADRANAVRQILEDEGLPASHMFMVAGKADSQPLFPDDPYIAANRRVTITLMREAPPLPVGLQAIAAQRGAGGRRDAMCTCGLQWSLRICPHIRSDGGCYKGVCSGSCTAARNSAHERSCPRYRCCRPSSADAASCSRRVSGR